jgi:hypothetical protein
MAVGGNYQGYVNYNYYFADAAARGESGGVVIYLGQGSINSANYRPNYTYASQSAYDDASSGGYLGYASLAFYTADTASREALPGTTATELADTLYASGNTAAVGVKGSYGSQSGTAYDGLGGDDTIGLNLDAGGLIYHDFIQGGAGNDKVMIN